jgi:two-component system cell cycle sensor histidine kinase/response regulator CckA
LISKELAVTKPREASSPSVVERDRHLILVVDDEEPLRVLAGEMLGLLGFSVETVPSGEAAVERFAHHPLPDLVLLDVIMPGMGGIEAFRRILQTAPTQKILIATGLADREAMMALEAEGASGFIQKPYRMETLADRVRALLR